jgi:nucleoside-triphosphatase
VSERLLLVLSEGRPGVGKTTVARRLGQFLRKAGVPLAGFVTEELREGGNRVGFALETFDGRHGVLAHVGLPGPPRVGKYGVDVAGFERLVLPAPLTARSLSSGSCVVISSQPRRERTRKPSLRPTTARKPSHLSSNA